MSDLQTPIRSENLPVVTRFAPSPTGFLHLGHAYAALFAYRAAKGPNLDGSGRFILRIEDIDAGRCRPEFETAIYEDLAWLGLEWEQPVRRQSDNLADFESALDRLNRMGLLYPCFCTRADIKAEIEAANGAPHLVASGPDGPIYPGTCLMLSDAERKARADSGTPFALRLDMARAIQAAGALHWIDAVQGRVSARPEIFGDVVLARKDIPTSYHLSVTIDDHLQGVTLVTRGEDLFPATHIHRLLQKLLGLDTPAYHHHGLLVAADGRRLAKRDKAETIRDLRQNGYSPSDVRRMAGFP
ncbi:tRNA glutamyl-Q(34) synthetase GluQRS [Magnetovibrio sp.]|uniref:tRNA glutamyl-Q(34) synthetase GluQRS n=1 Tax=Magnetovibrio sp. TaxID=2024836 RepID=UPI002F92358C